MFSWHRYHQGYKTRPTWLSSVSVTTRDTRWLGSRIKRHGKNRVLHFPARAESSGRCDVARGGPSLGRKRGQSLFTLRGEKKRTVPRTITPALLQNHSLIEGNISCASLRSNPPIPFNHKTGHSARRPGSNLLRVAGRVIPVQRFRRVDLQFHGPGEGG